MPAATQTRRILIKVDTTDSKGIQDIADKMGMLNRNTKSLSGNMAFLTNAFKGWLGLLGIRELVNISDQMQGLANRLKIVTNDGKPVAEVMESLRVIAKETYQPLSNVAEAYARMGSALKNVKATSGELAALTETLINTFRVAGTTTAETSNTMVQLSQSFSSGTLRGDELRSVLEQNAVLAGYLRKEFGTDLMAKAKEGMLKASTITALLIKNFDELQSQAKQLTPTFEQSMSNAMTDFSLAVYQVNTQMGLSLGFFNIMTGLLKNFGTIVSAVSAGALTYLVIQMGGLTAAITSMGIAIKALLIGSGPFGWAVLAAGAVGTLVYELGGLSNTLDYVAIGFLKVEKFAAESRLGLAKYVGNAKLQADAIADLASIEGKINARREEISKNNLASATADDKKRSEATKKQLQELLELQKRYEGVASKPTKLKDELATLNKAFDDGKISLAQYNAKLISFELYKANRQFREGKVDIFKYHEQLRDLNIADLNRELNVGAITLKQFNDEVSGEKLKVLDEQLKAGKISLAEYNKELTALEDKFRPGSAFQAGVQSYLSTVGTLSQGIAKGIGQAFQHLEDNLTEFIKTGTFNFSKFTQAILDDLTQIIIRASIVRPLAQGLLNLGGGDYTGNLPTAPNAGGGNYLTPSAKGNAFYGGNLIPFAKGGVIDSPTAFNFNGGNKRGIMGEAGSEAIIPLQRASNGDLGVAASVTPITVNIINNAGVDVQSQEKVGPGGERLLEVIILNTVKTGFAQGSFDKDMRTNYNVNRKGF